METIAIINALFALAQMIPKAGPAVKDLLSMLKGEAVADITHEELVLRVDEAIAKLPEWK